MLELTFAKRGHRRTPAGGLRYKTSDPRLFLYQSDRVAGIAVTPVRWLVLETEPGGGERVISRHRRRSAAETRCQEYWHSQHAGK